MSDSHHDHGETEDMNAVAQSPTKVLIVAPSGAVKSRLLFAYLATGEALLRPTFDFHALLDVEPDGDVKAILEMLGCRFDLVERLDLSCDLDIARIRTSDIMVLCGWGKKIGEAAISAPRIAALNCHSSYLPDYRGGSVYMYQWANCEKIGGASIHYLTNKFDDGNILAQQKFSIGRYDRPREILIKASELTGPLMVQSLFLARENHSGIRQTGGRYFTKVRHRWLYLHRLFNISAGRLFGRRWLTPHR